MRGHFTKAGVSPKLIVKEFPVTEDAHVPVGRTYTTRVLFCQELIFLQEQLYRLLILCPGSMWM